MKKNANEIKKNIRTIELIVLFIIISLGLGTHIFGMMMRVAGSFVGFNSQSIMYSKEHFYELNNEGIQGCKAYYDDITIQTPNDDDKLIVFNEGLKYVQYPDLMTLYLKDDFGDDEVKICNGVYIEKDKYSYICLEIKVDREYSSNIIYYEYQKKLNYKQIALDICILVLLILSSTELKNIIKDLLQKNEKSEKRKQNKAK